MALGAWACVWTCPAQAFVLAVGAGIVEQGDDRLEPAAAAILAVSESLALTAEAWGRSYGPVTQSTIMGSAVRSFAVGKSGLLSAHLGGTLMDEATTIKYSNPAYSGLNERKDAINLGANFGVSLNLPKSLSPLHGELSWDSHVFAAGGQGGLFLASGRKQVIAVLVGMHL